MTIDQMRTALGLDLSVSDADVVEAYAAYLLNGAPATEPVSLAEARKQLSMTDDDSTDDDEMITSMIAAARELVEKEAGLILTRRQIVEGATSFSGLTLSSWPIVSVDAIIYIDTSGVEQSLAAANFRTIIGRRNARVLPAIGGSLPYVHDCGSDAITIIAMAGFATPADVPEFCKRAILIMVSTWYRTREDWTMPQGVLDICQRPDRRYR